MSLTGPRAIGAAVAAARNFAESHGVGDAGAARLAIAVEELVTNLFEHGDLGADDLIDLRLTLSDQAIGLTITDQGRPFDPRSAVTQDKVPQRGGGAGLALVRAWASEANYEVSEAGNRLSISLPLEPR